MNFVSFKENVKRLLENNKYSKHKKLYEFIENYNTKTQIKYNTLSASSSNKIENKELTNIIVSLLDSEIQKMLFMQTMIRKQERIN